MYGHPAVPGRRGSSERAHAPKRQTASLDRRPGPPDQHQEPRNRPGLRRRRLSLAPLLRHAEGQGDRGAARGADAPHLAPGRHADTDLRPSERHRLHHPRSREARHAPHARHHARRRRGAFRVEDRERPASHDRPRTALPAGGRHAASRRPQAAAHPHRRPAVRRSQRHDFPPQQRFALQDPGAEVPPDGRQIPHAHRHGRHGRLHGLELLRLRGRQRGNLFRQPRHDVPGHGARTAPLPRRRRRIHAAGIGILQVPALLRRRNVDVRRQRHSPLHGFVARDLEALPPLGRHMVGPPRRADVGQEDAQLAADHLPPPVRRTAVQVHRPAGPHQGCRRERRGRRRLHLRMVGDGHGPRQSPLQRRSPRRAATQAGKRPSPTTRRTAARCCSISTAS